LHFAKISESDTVAEVTIGDDADAADDRSYVSDSKVEKWTSETHNQTLTNTKLSSITFATYFSLTKIYQLSSLIYLNFVP